MTEPILSIIIANYNGRKVLANCLEALYTNAPTCSFEVFVVDDASSDGSDEMVRDRFPQAYLIRNDRNEHYGRSNNRALELIRGRYIYLLNNDTVMLPKSIDRMIAFMEERPGLGVLGNRLLNEDGTVQASVKSLPCPSSGLFGARSIITKLFPGNRFSRRHLLHLSRDMGEPFPAGYVSSASMMIRREVVRRVGLLDERLSYHVDADYCKRVADAGWAIYYLPSATVIHLDHRGGTMVSRRRRFKSVVEFHRGSYIYFRKHWMTSRWHPLRALAITGLGFRFALSMLLFLAREVFIVIRAGRGRDWAREPSSGVLTAGPDQLGGACTSLTSRHVANTVLRSQKGGHPGTWPNGDETQSPICRISKPEGRATDPAPQPGGSRPSLGRAGSE